MKFSLTKLTKPEKRTLKKFEAGGVCELHYNIRARHVRLNFLAQ